MSIPKLKFTFSQPVKVTQQGFYANIRGQVMDRRWESEMQYLIRLYGVGNFHKDVWFNESELEDATGGI